MKRINATHYVDIPTFPRKRKRSDNVVNAIIETPKNSPHKYALNSALGIIAFHEILPDSMHWPYDYGFVTGTLAQDGDPLDILVIAQHGLFSGCLIEARIIGAVREKKDGVENDRLIAVPQPSPGAPSPTDAYVNFSDLPKTESADIKAFLKSYSQRQGHVIETKGTVQAAEALKLVAKSMKAFKKA